MKVEARRLGWGAFPGWRRSLQEASDPFRKLASNEEFSLRWRQSSLAPDERAPGAATAPIFISDLIRVNERASRAGLSPRSAQVALTTGAGCLKWATSQWNDARRPRLGDRHMLLVLLPSVDV